MEVPGGYCIVLARDDGQVAWVRREIRQAFAGMEVHVYGVAKTPDKAQKFDTMKEAQEAADKIMDSCQDLQTNSNTKVEVRPWPPEEPLADEDCWCLLVLSEDGKRSAWISKLDAPTTVKAEALRYSKLDAQEMADVLNGASKDDETIAALGGKCIVELDPFTSKVEAKGGFGGPKQ